MKTLQLIFMALAATLVVASCDDDSMNLDKARIKEVSDYGNVSVVVRDSSYLLSWKLPEIFTDKGHIAIAGNTGSPSYDVYLTTTLADTAIYLKTVDSCSAELKFSEVKDALGQSKKFVSNYMFGVSLKGTNIYNDMLCCSPVQMANNDTICSSIESYNYWFIDDRTGINNNVSVNENNEVVIESKSNTDPWIMQFCNVFHGLKNQTEGKHFKLSFDIKWQPDKKKYKNPSITIYTAKYGMKNGIVSALNSDLQWDLEYNTQLIFQNGVGWGDMGKHYEVDTKWEKISFEGTIGEMGADIISIQINLSGYSEGEDGKILHPNDDGTFYIKNIAVEIDGEVVAEYFTENRTYYDQAGNEVSLPPYRVFIEAKNEDGEPIDANEWIEINSNYVPFEDGDINYLVAGYEYGETAIITANDGNGYQFVRWHDGSTENHREFEMTEKFVSLTAIYERENYKLKNSYQKPNEWFLSGDNIPTGEVKDGNFYIKVKGVVGEDEDGNAAVWDDNFEIILQGYENQIREKVFQMKFDITWEGEKDIAYFRICSGVDNYIEEIVNVNPTFVPLTSEQVWDSVYNTELNFDSFKNRMGQTFSVSRGGVTPVEWGGKIGERGEDYIGIEINLSGIKNGEEIYENGPGTFTISNMQILIDEQPVWE